MDAAESRNSCCRPAAAPCCGPPPGTSGCPEYGSPAPWIVGSVPFAAGTAPAVATRLTVADRCDAVRARWGVRRMGWLIPPGLYAVGSPTADSPVLASANYKLSFDRLRSQLAGIDAWLLVLDTQGVNVWCAAGKGTFGTDELVRRIEQYGLSENTSHRTVVVPQLAAPGVAAHEVRKRTGVRAVFGPVRAEDLPAFLAAGMTATPEMRRVRFATRDRLALVPVEWVLRGKWALLVALVVFLSAGFGRGGYSALRLEQVGLPAAALILLAAFGSLALGPALLPWLPGRAFSLKGLWLGLAAAVAAFSLDWFAPAVRQNAAGGLGLALLATALASLAVLSFTGSATYTSLSGVRRETRIALPLQLLAATVGLGLWIAGRFL